MLYPAWDFAGNGVVDEDDRNADADGFSNRLEIAGSAFDPITATASQNRDSEGMNDGAETIAGTDPTKPASLLRPFSIKRIPAGLRIEWVARGSVDQRRLPSRTLDRRLGSLAPAVAGASPVFLS